MDSCLMYLAITSSPQTDLDILQTKDHDTRRYAKLQASGQRFVAPMFVFEIIEAPMHRAEKLLDEVADKPHLEDPEILLLAPIPHRHYKSWTQTQIPTPTNELRTADTLRMLAQQASLTPSSLSLVIPKIIDTLLNTPAHENQANQAA